MRPAVNQSPPITSSLPFSCHICGNPFMLWRAVLYVALSQRGMWGRESRVRVQGLFVSHKTEMWGEEWRLNERIEEGGKGGNKGVLQSQSKLQREMDCLSWSTAFVLWKQRGQRSLLNDVVRHVLTLGSAGFCLHFTVDQGRSVRLTFMLFRQSMKCTSLTWWEPQLYLSLQPFSMIFFHCIDLCIYCRIAFRNSDGVEIRQMFINALVQWQTSIIGLFRLWKSIRMCIFTADC